MKVAYVCSGGERRSPLLAVYSQLYAPKITFSSSPIDDCKIVRNDNNREERFSRLESFRDGVYADKVRALRDGGGNIHPRLGVLLLEDGVTQVSTHRSVPLLEASQDADLVLVVDPLMINRVRLAGVKADVQSVGNFLGVGGVVDDVRYGILGFSLGWQMSKDREFVERMKGLAYNITRKLI